MKARVTLYFCILFLSLASFSCKKKWQKTAPVNLQLTIAAPASTDHVAFSSGSVYLTRVAFSGKREQANDVSFTDYPNKTISFSGSNGSPILNYNIPQGTYSSINMEFELSKDNTGNSITLNGLYSSPNPNVGTVPVNFQINVGDVLKVLAVNQSGGNEISLSESKTSNVQVILNPAVWFSAIPQNTFDNAPQTVVNAQSTIVINANTNQNIYNTVISKIDQGTKVVFN